MRLAGISQMNKANTKIPRNRLTIIDGQSDECSERQWVCLPGWLVSMLEPGWQWRRLLYRAELAKRYQHNRPLLFHGRRQRDRRALFAADPPLANAGRRRDDWPVHGVTSEAAGPRENGIPNNIALAVQQPFT